MKGAETVDRSTGRRESKTDVAVKVLVLAGGRSAERDVSLASGAAVSRALAQAGGEVLTLDPGGLKRAVGWNDAASAQPIGAAPPAGAHAAPGAAALTPSDLSLDDLRAVDVVFIALHGGDGENGRLQALLDMARIPYTGSGMQACALAMDKHAAKRIFVAEGIPTPPWRILSESDEYSFDEITDALGKPLIVKPNSQGSSVGMNRVETKSQWDKALTEAFRWDERVLVEEYIAGRELTVAVLGEEALPVVEIIPADGLYDYEHKYTSGQSEYVCPAQLSPAQIRALQEQGLEAFRALGCRGYARVDFRLSNDGHPYCLEVNTAPGMTATSLVPKAAKAAGIEFPELLQRICRLAMGAL
ncbi:MAG: D-alanine--D-alanine ligase [candidate division Zixibacteria bacterium]|nr:D-alanine--D-alanine ligase [candidate division Zixibacteria bacterium]